MGYFQPMKWAVGLTTVPKRRRDLLPRTLKSLRESGFPSPRLFVDGCSPEEVDGWRKEFGLEVTPRYPVIKTFGNWILGLAELYIRTPHADRFAMFQDDFVIGKNLREYMEKCPIPIKGYYNLYTFPKNLTLCPVNQENGRKRTGWFLSDQLGKGAVALVFTNEAAIALLHHTHIIMRPKGANPDRTHKFIDGGIVEAMTKAGWKEYCHNPSLVQHTGLVSTVKNLPHERANSFQGEEFDYLSLLPY